MLTSITFDPRALKFYFPKNPCRRKRLRLQGRRTCADDSSSYSERRGNERRTIQRLITYRVPPQYCTSQSAGPLSGC
jgi:hypothetical protein